VSVVAEPRDVLNPKDYRNYRNIRAISVLFIIFGGLLALGGLVLAFAEPSPEMRASKEEVPTWAAALIAAVGFFGVIGGIAARRGNRRWAPLVYVMAAFYILSFPVGTRAVLNLM
jgi:hypothetical protein